jgi:thiol-disulfide isomerase/thioredoxin
MDRIKKGAEWLVHNKTMVGYAFIALFFAVIAQQLYNRYVKSNQTASYYEGYSNVTNSSTDDSKIATIRLFKVGWCPHCKTALPEFQEVENEYAGKIVNGYKLEFVVMDGDNEEEETQSLIKKYNVKGYPTVVMTKDGKTIEYDAKVDKPTLVTFINTMV